MAATSALENYDRMTDGRLSTLLRALADDDVTPTKAASLVYRDFGIVVSPTTVRRWMGEFSAGPG